MAEVYYRKIDPSDVDWGLAWTADLAIARARLDLRLPPVKILWVRRVSKAEHDRAEAGAELLRSVDSLSYLAAGGPDLSFKDSPVIKDGGAAFLGRVNPFGMELGNGRGFKEPEIMLSTDQSSDELRHTVFHEMKHLADFRDRLFNCLTPAGIAAMEKSADRYADRMIGK